MNRKPPGVATANTAFWIEKFAPQTTMVASAAQNA